jgi:hypothetical protein
MTQEEVRTRALYLFLACSQVVDQLKEELLGKLPVAGSALRPMTVQIVRRELGLLFRYWATRQIWQRLEAYEADAKALNLALLRLFTEGLKLPRDGSGLKYASISNLADAVRELSQRLHHGLGQEYPQLLSHLQAGILTWHDVVKRHTDEALEWPLEQLAARVKSWAERPPEE